MIKLEVAIDFRVREIAYLESLERRGWPAPLGWNWDFEDYRPVRRAEQERLSRFRRQLGALRALPVDASQDQIAEVLA